MRHSQIGLHVGAAVGGITGATEGANVGGGTGPLVGAGDCFATGAPVVGTTFGKVGTPVGVTVSCGVPFAKVGVAVGARVGDFVGALVTGSSGG